ncbi:MAG: polysaccharide biosynthesis protein [Acidobacteria bacterium]|nr:polysaccharide biosynthesis protein [Acidobacteriota bacterium]
MTTAQRLACGLAEAAIQYRRIGNVLLHILLAASANSVAFWLRFDGQVPVDQTALRLNLVPALLLVRVVTLLPFRLYEGVWRYTGWWDLRNTVLAVVASSTAFFVLVHGILGNERYPRSVFIIEALLLIFMMCGVRAIGRVSRELWGFRRHRRVLICGAGDAGAMLAREMREHSGYLPVGFVDDDRRKLGQRIHGAPVLGTRKDLPWIVERYAPEEALIAMPGAGPAAVRAFVEALRPFKLLITTTPGAREIIDGKVAVGQIRKLQIEDLLSRAPIVPQPLLVKELIRGRRILVTGAGGSIGSELCRQIALLEPEVLVLFERHENALYEIASSLADQGLRSVRPVVGDITDQKRVDAVFAEHRPELVFHAAAHKHVPMMEDNPCEAVKNNVGGTRTLVDAARRHDVGTFVLISTDKAVNPTSVMGATKRVAELMVRAQRANGTSYLTVRFGNVLASNGSVVPRFLEQIRAGGPLTVTHPDVTRYFMLIPEAVHLVLQAAAVGEHGSTYVLDMGEQIRVADMARTLIRLCGFVPDEEIRVDFVGLRPGEKLFEELVTEDETVRRSAVDHVLEVMPARGPDVRSLAARVRELEAAAAADDAAGVLALLKRVVPEYEPPEIGEAPTTPAPVPTAPHVLAAKKVRFA